MTDQKRPLESALDLMVYAPLGLALDARKLLPSLVERGRNQVTMAKMVGQFAVQQGKVEAGKRLEGAQSKADAMLGEFGLRPLPESDEAPSTAVAARPAAAERPTTQSGAGAADLPITDYDSLAASQVIPRLDGLSSDELDQVATYETAHRGRKTILGKISQLREA